MLCTVSGHNRYVDSQSSRERHQQMAHLLSRKEDTTQCRINRVGPGADQFCNHVEKLLSLNYIFA